MTCHRCGSDKHLIMDCKMKGKGKGKIRSHFDEGLWAGYSGGGSPLTIWPSTDIGSEMFSGVTVAAEENGATAATEYFQMTPRPPHATLAVLDEEVADPYPEPDEPSDEPSDEPYRATSQRPHSVQNLVDMYQSMNSLDSPRRPSRLASSSEWTFTAPTSGQQSHIHSPWLPSHSSGGLPLTGEDGEEGENAQEEDQDDGDVE